MLVLSRKKRQTIVIGDDIVITIHRIAGAVVRVAIEAPKDINIRRGELPKEGKR